MIYSFFGMILINCQEMDFIELFKRSFSRSERLARGLKVKIGHNIYTADKSAKLFFVIRVGHSDQF